MEEVFQVGEVLVFFQESNDLVKNVLAFSNLGSSGNCGLECVSLGVSVFFELLDSLDAVVEKSEEALSELVDFDLGAAEFEQLNVLESAGNDLLSGQ